jgi:hypothetical protein
MGRPTLKQKLRYRFDNFMAKGGTSIFITVILAFIVGYILIGLLRVFIEWNGASAARGEGFFRQIYITFLQMTNPGNMSQDIDSSPWIKLPTIIAGLDLDWSNHHIPRCQVRRAAQRPLYCNRRGPQLDLRLERTAHYRNLARVDLSQ